MRRRKSERERKIHREREREREKFNFVLRKLGKKKKKKKFGTSGVIPFYDQIIQAHLIGSWDCFYYFLACKQERA